MADEPGSTSPLVDMVMEIINSDDREHAIQLLSAANDDLELAVALHFGEDAFAAPTTMSNPMAAIPQVVPIHAQGVPTQRQNGGNSGQPMSLIEELNRELVSDAAPRTPRLPQTRRVGLWPLAIIALPLRGAKAIVTALLAMVVLVIPGLPRFLGISRSCDRWAAVRPASSSRNGEPLLQQEPQPGQTLDEGRVEERSALDIAAGRKVDVNCVRGAYLDALDTARRDLKHLIVVLVAPYHQDAAVHAKLCEDAFTPAVLQRTESLVWAGLTTDSEAYQLASMLQISELPAIACIAPSPKTPQSSTIVMEVLARWPYRTDLKSQQVRVQLEAAVEVHRPRLLSLRLDRDRFAADRSIRADQDRAYEASLAADRERAQQQQAEQETERAKQRAAERFGLNLAAYKRQRWAVLNAAQPAKDTRACTVQLRLPDGSRKVVRLAPEAPTRDLYDWVLCMGEEESTEPTAQFAAPDVGFTPKYDFDLVSPMPRQVLPNGDDPVSGQTVIWPQGTLIVDTFDDDSE